MPKIKRIVAKKRSSNCYVHFDDFDVYEISTDLVLKYSLAKDVTIPDEAWEQIRQQQDIINAKQAAYNYAAYKPRTEFQVRKRLKERGYEDNLVWEAIEFIKKFDLLDDELFASSFAKDYLKRKPSGERKLKQELLQRGVGKDLAEKAAHAAYVGEDPYEKAKLAAEKKLRGISYKPADKQRNAIINKLKALGFEWDIIKRVVDELME
jgi:regulatory protein